MKGSGSDHLDVRVDLRGALAVVRDQGARPACLACAASDAHTHCHKRTRPLSAEFLFYHAGQVMPGRDVARGLTFAAVDTALRAEGQPDEEEWPYADAHPNPWAPPSVTQRWYGCLTSEGAAVHEIIKTVEAHRPVVLGVRLTLDFVNLHAAPHIIHATGRGFGGHAVLAIGLADHRDVGPLILIRNSWGPGWGDQGYAWLSGDYLTENLIGYRLVRPLPQP